MSGCTLQVQGQDKGRGEVEQLYQNDKKKVKYLVRKPGEAEEGDDDEEHLDHPLLVGQHCPIPHSVPLARRPVEYHQEEGMLIFSYASSSSLHPCQSVTWSFELA